MFPAIMTVHVFLVMNTNILRALFKGISYRIFFGTRNDMPSAPPFAPDMDVDILYGGFTMQEISVAANSIKERYRKPMSLLNAGFGRKETASLLGISEWRLIRRIDKGHRLFMKALQENRSRRH